MKRTPTILISLLLAIPMQAQMTLNDCLVYARKHAHSNRINRMEVEVAAANKRIGVADMLPYVGLGANGSLSFGRNIDPETNTYDNKKTLGTGFGIDLSLPLFDGLVRINNVKALKAAELRKKQSRLVEEDRISLEVIKDFYNVSYCRAMVEQMDRQLRRDSTDLLATERGEELGTKSGADVAELKAIVAADLYELANQRNLLKKAYLTLRSAMGMPLTDEPLQLVDSTPTLVDSPHLLDTQYPISEIPFSRNLPDIEEAELAVKESRHYLNAAKGGYSPRINFTAGISTSYYRMMGMGMEATSFSRQFRDNMGEYIGFSFSFPIFDGLATTNRVKRAKFNLLETQIRLEQTEYQIQKATEEARLDRMAAIEELSAASQRLEAEQIAYKAMRRKFELGMASAIDLYTSGSKLATAEA
ncbi:MAG: TolC family protein, partial [Muribaculaceae bacterium]|nr:TolC family protein [Muribaculaceae bacterium]